MRRAAFKALCTPLPSASLARSAPRASFLKASSLSLPSSRNSLPSIISFRSYATGNSSDDNAPVRGIDSADEIPSPLNDPVNAARSGFEAVRDAAGFGQSRQRRERPARDPAPPGPRIYIGNLLFETEEETVREAFGQFGEVLSVNLVEDSRGLRKGWAFVEFGSTEQATAAVEGMHGQEFNTRRVAVQFAQPPRERPQGRPQQLNEPSKTLYIGNMSFEMTDQDLNNLFAQTDNVLDVRVAMDRATGQPRGFAHADFLTQEDADKASKWLSTQRFNGRPLRVSYARAVTPRTGGFRRDSNDGQTQEQ